MRGFRTIGMRILGGFLAVLVLQVVAAAMVWHTARGVDHLQTLAVDEALAARQLPILSGALRDTHQRVSDVLRGGGAAEFVSVNAALVKMDTLVAAVSAAGDGGLTAAAHSIHTALDATLAAAKAKRDAANAVSELAVQIQNAVAALAQSTTLLTDPAIAGSSAMAAASIAPTLANGLKYAFGEAARDRSVAHDAIGRAKQALAILSESLDASATAVAVPERVTRLSGVLDLGLGRLDPALSAVEASIAARRRSLAELNDAFAAAAQEIAGLDARHQAASAQLQADMNHGRVVTRTTVIGSAAVSLLVGLTLALLVGRSITGPVGRLGLAMGRIAGGELDQPVSDQTRQDEIGAMAVALLALRDAALKARTLEAAAQTQRGLAEAQQEAAHAAEQRAAAAQSVVVEGLAGGLAGLASGNLTCQIGTAFSPDYERLRTDFNAAMTELQTTMTVIVGHTGGIRSGAGEITQAADDLSRRTEQQAASLEETAAALEQITATVRKTAQGAVEARSFVATAKSDAEASGAVVKDAVAAMSEIEASAGKMSEIIGVIDAIAFQTNLLALNAGVEAARAGETGRGFAVVASEVRALAQRSAEAAKQIKALITASSVQVTKGVSLVAQTGHALEGIVTRVSQINGVVAEIAASAQEQATALNEVSTAINQMDQMTQQNAAMVEQSTAASHSLSKEADELMQLTARFELGPVNAAPVARQAARNPPPQTLRRAHA